MANPFSQSPGERVLDPCEDLNDLALYLDIDSHQNSFDEVVVQFESHNPLEDGSAVLVYGKTGFGKSALGNRIAHRWAEDFGAHRQVVVVHLDSDIGQSGMALPSKVRTQLQLLADKLRRSFLKKPEADALDERIDEPTLFMAYLEDLLREHDVLLVLLFASFELESELDSAVRLWRRRRVMNIFSTASEQIVERSKNLYGKMSQMPVSLVGVGPLRLQDGWTYVQDRTLRLPVGDRPTVTQDVLDEYMKQRLPNSEISVRELHRTCLAVFAHVIREGRNEVTLDDFAHYWLRVGR